MANSALAFSAVSLLGIPKGSASHGRYYSLSSYCIFSCRAEEYGAGIASRTQLSEKNGQTLRRRLRGSFKLKFSAQRRQFFAFLVTRRKSPIDYIPPCCMYYVVPSSQHTLHILVDDVAETLTRLVGLISRQGCKVDRVAIPGHAKTISHLIQQLSKSVEEVGGSVIGAITGVVFSMSNSAGDWREQFGNKSYNTTTEASAESKAETEGREIPDPFKEAYAAISEAAEGPKSPSPPDITSSDKPAQGSNGNGGNVGQPPPDPPPLPPDLPLTTAIVQVSPPRRRINPWLVRIRFILSKLRAFLSTPVVRSLLQALQRFLSRMSGRLRRLLVVGVGCLLLSTVVLESFSMLPGAEVRRNLKIFQQVYEDVYKGYVDPVDPSKLIQVGIDGMLSTLDPYTTFIDEANTEELGVLTYGLYGGVGLTIGEHEGNVVVFGTLSGYSAFERGVRTGDAILKIDRKPVDNMSVTEVRNLLRGDPGTSVTITIQRLAAKDGALVPITKTFELVRSRVHLQNVTYSGFLNDDAKRGIGYIRLERFATSCGEEVRDAIVGLQEKGKLKGLVLDVRGNPGGLLEAAIDVTQQFVPRSSVIVTTHGRLSESRRVYRTSGAPLVPNTPLAILTNGETASAAEIVAGAVQDLDRGIIVGERTYGKGLIQKIKFLPFNTALKYTIGKYHTASGRCIQSINYSMAPSQESRGIDGFELGRRAPQQMDPTENERSGGEGVSAGMAGSTGVQVTDDERRAFSTKQGRTVRDGGGIEPDVIVGGGTSGSLSNSDSSADMSELEETLLSKLQFFAFANRFAAMHPTIPDSFQVTSEIFSQFQSFLVSRGFHFQSSVESVFDALGVELRQRGYQSALQSINSVRGQLAREKALDFRRHEARLKERLRDEIMARYFDDSARIRASLASDSQLLKAVALLESPSQYSSLLSPPTLSSSSSSATNRKLESSPVAFILLKQMPHSSRSSPRIVLRLPDPP